MIKLNITDKDIYDRIIAPFSIGINHKIYPSPGDKPVYVNEYYRLIEDGMEWPIGNFISDPKFLKFAFIIKRTGETREVINPYSPAEFKYNFLQKVQEDTPYYVKRDGKFISDYPFILDDSWYVTLEETGESHAMPDFFTGEMELYTEEEYEKIMQEGKENPVIKFKITYKVSDKSIDEDLLKERFYMDLHADTYDTYPSKNLIFERIHEELKEHREELLKNILKNHADDIIDYYTWLEYDIEKHEEEEKIEEE